MSDQRALKLAKKFEIPLRLARALVAAGYAKPTQIRAAKQSDLVKVPGIGPVLARRLRGK